MPENNESSKLDIPEFLRRKPGDRAQAWEASRTPVRQPVPEVKLSSGEQWRKDRDALYAREAEEFYAKQEQKENGES